LEAQTSDTPSIPGTTGNPPRIKGFVPGRSKTPIAMTSSAEEQACKPNPVDPRDFNPRCSLPYGLTVIHVRKAMEEFLDFLGFVNHQLHSRHTPRLESILMPANFSSVVGEMMKANIPKQCALLSANQYHNGHPDLIPTGRFSGNAVQHSEEGIELKGSRYERGWQGHNPENVWLMVFVFDSNRPADLHQGIRPKPFRFRMVLAAQLVKEDWRFAGRSPTSRRTITASVTESGYEKMMRNWVYRESSLVEQPRIG